MSIKEGIPYPKIQQAKMFAMGAHVGHKHSSRPFWCHLRDTVNIIMRHKLDTVDLLCAAWLHDVIEDTPATYQDIRELFGEKIADLVWAVTDEMGRNRYERLQKSREKNFATRESTILKTADLAANINASFEHEDFNHLVMYKTEWPSISELFFDKIQEKAPKAMPILADINHLMWKEINPKNE